MTVLDHDPYGQARRHIEAVVDHLHLDPRTAKALRDAHEAAVRTSLDGGVSYADHSGALVPEMDTAGWLRSIDRDRPHLVGKVPKAKPPTDSPGSPPAVSPSPIRSAPTSTVTVQGGSFSDLHARAASGDATALRQVQEDMRQKFGLPDPSTPNLSQLMAAAKRGDTAALATIKEKIKK